jgi:ABC-2 type transport system ATP-binding protein
MSVEVTHLSKTYGTQHAVHDISFKAGKGEILGFLGPNGAGKSTTMKIATCYIPPSSGSIKVCGFDVQESSMEVRKHVGYLPEHNPLYLDMYVHEYLHFAGSLHKLGKNLLNKRVLEMVDICGLKVEQNKKIGALSKGYRQRVGLAQALIHDPQVLILDEPTTGLDPNQIQEIRNLIINIGKEKTVIFSTHIMQEVQAICDRVVIINKGKIVADSKVSELKSSIRNTIVITAEFNQDINSDILKSIEGVSEVQYMGGGKYQVHCLSGKDIRGDIFKKASENSWTLIGLKQEESSIENIFRELTNKQ